MQWAVGLVATVLCWKGGAQLCWSFQAGLLASKLHASPKCGDHERLVPPETGGAPWWRAGAARSRWQQCQQQGKVASGEWGPPTDTAGCVSGKWG